MPVQWTLILPALAGKETRQIEVNGTMKVGRASRNDIVVEDNSTSSSHATMELRGEHLFVRDHGSTNGTTINGGARLPMGEWSPVPHDATVRFGVINTRLVAKEKEVVDLDATLASTRPPAAVHQAAPMPAPAAPRATVPAAPAMQAAAAPFEPAVAPSPQPVPAAYAPAPGVDPMVDPPLDGTFSSTISDESMGPGAGAAAAHALEQMEARLILLDEVNPRAIRITEMIHEIGRSMSVSCRIDSKLVSSEHAVLSFSPSTRAFQLQDVGSSNHTVLNRVTLTPNVAHRLELDSALQFGPIEAVFRVDHDIDGTRLPANFDLQVAEALIAASKLSEDALVSATAFAKESAGFLGDGLLLSGAVSPNDWADAARTARQSAPVLPYRAAKSSNWFLKFVVLALVLVLGVAAVYLFGSDELVAKLPKLPQLKVGK